MPRRDYYIHRYPEEMFLSQRGSKGNDLLVQVKPLSRSRTVPLPKLPSLHTYPKPKYASETSSVGSSELLSPRYRHQGRLLLPKLTSGAQTEGDIDQAESDGSKINKEPVKVNFLNASDLQDLVGKNKQIKVTLNLSTRQSFPAWSNRPLIKRKKLFYCKPVEPKPSRAIENTRKSILKSSGGLGGINPGVLVRENYVYTDSHLNDIHNVYNENIPPSFIPHIEGDVLSNRDKRTKKLVNNAFITLQKYDSEYIPIDNLNKSKQEKSGQRRMSLDSIPEGENEVQDINSDDAWSNYSNESRGSGRRTIRDKKVGNLSWRPKTPVLSKPALDMIPENDQHSSPTYTKKRIEKMSNTYIELNLDNESSKVTSIETRLSLYKGENRDNVLKPVNRSFYDSFASSKQARYQFRAGLKSSTNILNARVKIKKKPTKHVKFVKG